MRWYLAHKIAIHYYILRYKLLQTDDRPVIKENKYRVSRLFVIHGLGIHQTLLNAKKNWLSVYLHNKYPMLVRDLVSSSDFLVAVIVIVDRKTLPWTEDLLSKVRKKTSSCVGRTSDSVDLVITNLHTNCKTVIAVLMSENNQF